MLASISFNQSHKSSLSHNNRDHKSGNKDIDESRSHLNIYFVKEDIREVYKELFQDSVDTYNEKQKRQDRKIENYYDKVHHDKKTHEQRELVVAIGAGKDPEEHRSGKKEALIQYAEEFQERNPNLRVYNMVLHDDEANPHLHINYVPHFDSKRGLSKRVGMDKALQQQGIEGKGTELIGKWRAIETSRIEALAKEHLHDFERANVGSHKYMKVQEYKEYADSLGEIEIEIENQKNELEDIDRFVKHEQGKLSELDQQKDYLVNGIIEKNFELKKIEKDFSRFESSLKDKKMELQRSAEKLDHLKKEISKIETPLVELDSIKETKIFNKVTVNQQDYEILKNMAKKSLSDKKIGLELENENHELKKQVVQYQKKNQDQERQLNVLEQQRESYRVESLNLKKENKKLLQERNVFQRLYEMVKAWLKNQNHNLEALEKQEKKIEKEEKENHKELEIER